MPDAGYDSPSAAIPEWLLAAVDQLTREAAGWRGELDRPVYGLDLVKEMPSEWSDERRLAEMVRHYDNLLHVIRETGSDSGSLSQGSG